MNETEKEFAELYEKLDLFLRNSEDYQEGGVDDYIREMEEEKDADGVIPGWNWDLLELKHMKEIFEAIMNDDESVGCTKDDLGTMEVIYGRFMRRDDPLGRFYSKPKEYGVDDYKEYRVEPKRKGSSGPLLVYMLVLMIFIAASVIILYVYLKIRTA